MLDNDGRILKLISELLSLQRDRLYQGEASGWKKSYPLYVGEVCGPKSSFEGRNGIQAVDGRLAMVWTFSAPCRRFRGF